MKNKLHHLFIASIVSLSFVFLSTSHASSADIKEYNVKGDVLRDYKFNVGEVPLLSKFWFNYKSGDHHLTHIAEFTQMGH